VRKGRLKTGFLQRQPLGGGGILAAPKPHFSDGLKIKKCRHSRVYAPKECWRE